MINPIELIRQGKSIPDVLSVTASLNEDDLDRIFAETDSQTLAEIGHWTARRLGESRIDATLMQGGVLEIYRASTKAPDRAELFSKLLDELGLGSTQAYRCIGVWRRAGKVLLAEPELKPFMVVEALKMLTQSSVPDSVLEAAFDLARNGNRVDINKAKYLIKREKASSSADQSKTSGAEKESDVTPETETAKGVQENQLVFCGATTRIVLEPSGDPRDVDLYAAIRDLMAFIDQLKRDMLGGNDSRAAVSA